MKQAQDVHDFWFGPLSGPADFPKDRAKNWFKKDEGFDASIREQFGDLWQQAMAGELDSWTQSPETLMGYVILTDQFPRNMHRNKPDAFASDPLALRAAKLAVDQGWNKQMLPVERMFLYLPFEHSENIDDQEQAIKLMQILAQDAPKELASTYNSLIDYAVRHRDIIAKFGRFPHRNEILGRESSEDELEFLKQPGSSF